MVNAQEWLDKNYPLEQSNEVKEIYLNAPDLEGELDLSKFPYLWYVYISLSVDETKLVIKNKLESARIVKLVSVHSYVNQYYPTKEVKTKVENLKIINSGLEGDLNLIDFINLKELDCRYNKITSLNLNNCPQLWKIECSGNRLINLNVSNCPYVIEIDCGDNLLTNLILPNNSTSLKQLHLSNNNFPTQDLSFLIGVINLESIYLGNWNKEKINKGIYNRFTGSLNYLSNMKKLKTLDVRNTDINEVNFDNLPRSLECIWYPTEYRPDCKLTQIVPRLEKYEWKDIHTSFFLNLRRAWEKAGVNKEQVREWVRAGLVPGNYFLGAYAKHKGYQPTQTNPGELEKEYEEWRNNNPLAQEYLDIFYPDKERREQIVKLDINGDNKLNSSRLKGELDLSEFTNLREIICWKNKLNSLNVTNCLQLDKIDCYRNQLISLDISNHSKLSWLNCMGNQLTNLHLSDCLSLTILNCSGNQLVNLDVKDCSFLSCLCCSRNSLINLVLPNNLINLKILDLGYNNFPPQDLSFLVPYANLERLNLTHNKFTGSLNYLSGMQQLKELDISSTDINEVDINKLPFSLEKISYFIIGRPDSKLTQIIPQLDRRSYGICQKCRQFNTNKNWCQPCAEKEWKQDLKQLTGQELVEKFIQQQSCLKWIPYEQFTDIKYLAEGGFSRIYKAWWSEGETRKWTSCKTWETAHGEDVVLKVPNNSQNISLDFLTEVANNKLAEFGTNFDVVTCYGISQDPITRDYVIVMQYMKGGNLRQYLQREGKELKFYNKLKKLKGIAFGLSHIHRHGLIHRDFHSGNILESSLDFVHITDLGLCRPADEKDSSKVYGVLPYVAPEVLQGKPYTQKSDIYSFGIIAYELFSNSYPYPDLDGMDLSLKVCQGHRPNIDKLKIPQLLKDLIKRCWDADHKQRPSAEELHELWPSGFEKKYEIAFEYNQWSQSTPYKIHSTAVLTSKLINTEEITAKLQTLKTTEIGSRKIELVEIAQEEEHQEASNEDSLQAQIQILPKGSNN